MPEGKLTAIASHDIPSGADDDEHERANGDPLEVRVTQDRNGDRCEDSDG